MKETSKAQRRRCKETSEGGFDWGKIFTGEMLDVGSGDDPLPGAIPFNLPDGAGDDLTKFFPFTKFDVIHGSNVLEHALSPEVMLQSWLDCLKLGGYIVATVPDYELYEKSIWPSRFNAGHQSTWSMTVTKSESPIHKLPEWLLQFVVDILLCRLIDTSDHKLPYDLDQTFPADGAEVFIEMVLRKK
jgi:SAM-dependent methyltransferase